MCNHSHGVPPRDMLMIFPTRYINSTLRFLHYYHQLSISIFIISLNMAAQLPIPQILSQALSIMLIKYAKLTNFSALD